MAQVIEMNGMDQAAFMESQAERYAYLLEALKECVELGVSLKSVKTLMYETGVDVSDVGNICNKIINKGQ